MKLKIMAAALGAVLVVPTVAPEAALARHHHYHGYANYSRTRCGGGNGAVGTIGGGVGGALLGNALGGGTLGTVAGGVGGALLGRHLDKQNTKARRGC